MVVLSLPAYIVKLSIGPVPTQLNELILWGVTIGWVVRQPLANLKSLFSQYRAIWWQLLLIAIGLIISVAVSSDLRLSLGIVKGWFVDPLLFFGLAMSIMTGPLVEESVVMLLLSTLPISVYALFQVVTRHFVTIDARASAWFASANYLALYLVPILLLGFTFILRDKRHTSSLVLFWLTFVSGLLAIYFSYSYGGWLGLAAGLLVIGIWHFRTKWQFWLASVGILGLAGVTQLSTERVANMLNLKAQSSASVRLQIWATDWLMTKTHWLTGIGLGQYPLRYPTTVTQLFSSPLEPNMLHAHNLYFQFIINLGLAGLAGFISLVVTFFNWLRHSAKLWAVPLAAAMTAILAHGLVDTPYWKNDLAMLFWLLIAIGLFTSKRPLRTHE